MTEPKLDHLTTEARNPASADLCTMSAQELVALMNREDAVVVAAVAAERDAIAQAIEQIGARMARGGRLIYTGAGTSGRLGVVDASECPPTFSVPPELVVGLIAGGERAFLKAVEGAEDSAELGAEDLRKLEICPDDSVVGIASSGRTPYVIGGLEYARSLGAYTLGFSCNADSPVAAVAEHQIVPVVGPEILSGSTRLKAGTATKMVLNMLSTGVMVSLGKTFGNLMVDLQASNEKLVVRSRRIVAQATDLDEDAARLALERCDGEVKTSIVSILADVDGETARRRLVEAKGKVRDAIR